MIYKITKAEDKEWNGKRFVEAVLQPMEGGEFTKVSFWNGEITEPDGSFKATIDGDLGKNAKGYPVLTTAKKAASGAYMNAQKVEGQKEIENIRNEHIKANMHDKEQSIAWFNSRNTALEFTKSFCAEKLLSPSEALELIEKYTKIFYAQWATWDNQPF